MRNWFKKKPQYPDNYDRRKKVLEEFDNFVPKYKAVEGADGKYTLFFERAEAKLGETPDEDTVIIVWLPFREEPNSFEVKRFDSIKDIEVFLRRKVRPNIVHFDEKGDKVA